MRDLSAFSQMEVVAWLTNLEAIAQTKRLTSTGTAKIRPIVIGAPVRAGKNATIRSSAPTSTMCSDNTDAAPAAGVDLPRI
jgi:hypothetical protein